MRRFIIVLCLIASSGIVCAQELNPTQEKLRSEIKAFLQQEGFVPSIDSDGDIAFKSEGSNYWISISPEDDMPMFTSLNIGFSRPEGYSVNSLKLAAAESNYCKGVKVIASEEALTICSELYVLNSGQFKYAFYTMLSQIKAVASTFLETCDKYNDTASKSTKSSSYSESNSSSSSSSSSSNLRTVKSKNVSIKVSEQIQLVVDGKKVTYWESDDEKVARVSSSGILTGVSTGSTIVWAHFGNDVQLFNVNVNATASSSSSYASSSTASSTRTIYSKEATIKVGDIVTAILPDGKIDKWEINSNTAQYIKDNSNGTITAIKEGSTSIWGYIGSSPKLFKFTIVSAKARVPEDRAPYVVKSKEFTMYVGDHITAQLNEGIVTRWEFQSYHHDYLSVDKNVLTARKPGNVSIWGYVGDSPKWFKITIKAR